MLVCTVDAQVLLLKRRQPVFWQSVTGSLEPEEVPLQAAVRELAEETGLTGCTIVDCQHSEQFEISEHWRHKYAPDTRFNREHVFLCRLPDTTSDIKLSRSEHTDFRWCDLATAIEEVWSWTNKAALQRFVAGGNG